MKALTIRQPWAWTIVHAGLGYDKEAELPRGIKVATDREIVHGAILGIVDLVDVVEKHRSKWFRGPFGFVLANARALSKPIVCPGRLSLWDVPPNVLSLIRKQIQDVM